MSDKPNLNKIKEMLREIEKAGWKIEIDSTDAVPHEDSIWWYEYDDEAPILSIVKGKHHLDLITHGDIEIFNEKDDLDYFIYKEGSRLEGSLTPNLVKFGRYETNNWFEINQDENSYDIMEENYSSLTEAVKALMERAIAAKQ